jgi:serine/threonine protein kinase
LRQWLHDRGRPSLTEVRDLMNQLMRGLLAFHRLEMVHRDIKPENILIDRNGTLKIIDFGSTRIAGIDEIDRPLAQQGNVVGTYNYSAPELMDGEPGSERCDLFSVGVIAYELLTGGHLPYGEITSPRKLQRAAYRPARDYNADIPPWMDAALGKAIEKKPGQRYTLLSEFVHDLSHPNPEFTGTRFRPLIERNPVRFWQLLLAVSVVLNAVLIYLLDQ